MLPVLPSRWAARPVALFAAVPALVATLLVGGARSQGQASGLIAFARADGIYVMEADGSGVRVLRRGGVASQPRDLEWSRDGSRLLFVDRTDGIWAMDADGSNPVQVAAGRSPTWSADGRRVAFVKYGNHGYIWVVRADGSHAHRLVKTPSAFVWDVDWNPAAGNRIAFTTGGYIPEVYVMDTSGRNARNLTPDLLTGAEPAWSPDGRRIAFSSDWSMRKSEIYVVDPGGGPPVRLTRNTVYDGTPTWSPAGSTIAFVRSTGRGTLCPNCPPAARGAAEIYRVNADGTGLTRLTHNGITEASPAWQPVAGA